MANGKDLQREITMLERAVRDAAKQAETVESALDDLEGHRNELAGRLAIARQAAADYSARLEERRKELARARQAEAEAKMLEAVRERDEAAKRAAESTAELLELLERLDAAREEVGERAAEAESNLGRRPDVRPEPEELEQAWARLVGLVRQRAQLELEDELVEAAVSSPLGFEIDKLPEHLRLLARRRWQARMRSAHAAGGRNTPDAS